MSRFAKTNRVFFVEEPIFYDGAPELKVSPREANLYVVVPHLPHDTDRNLINDLQRQMLGDLMASYNVENFVSWSYTPMMLAWTKHLEPQTTVYDCMDELSGFKFAPSELIKNEAEGKHRLIESFKYEMRQRSIAGDIYTQATSIEEEVNGIIDPASGELLVPAGLLNSSALIDFDKIDTKQKPN